MYSSQNSLGSLPVLLNSVVASGYMANSDASCCRKSAAVILPMDLCGNIAIGLSHDIVGNGSWPSRKLSYRTTRGIAALVMTTAFGLKTAVLFFAGIGTVPATSINHRDERCSGEESIAG